MVGQGLGTHTMHVPQHSLPGLQCAHTCKGRMGPSGTLTRGSLYLGWPRPRLLPPVMEAVLADGWNGGSSKNTGCGASQAWPRSQLSHAMAV